MRAPLNRTNTKPTRKPRVDLELLAAAEAYRVNDAVIVSRLSRSSLYDLMNSGQLKSRVIAGRRLIMRRDLLALLHGPPTAKTSFNILF